jgi:hypothetical protein
MEVNLPGKILLRSNTALANLGFCDAYIYMEANGKSMNTQEA